MSIENKPPGSVVFQTSVAREPGRPTSMTRESNVVPSGPNTRPVTTNRRGDGTSQTSMPSVDSPATTSMAVPGSASGTPGKSVASGRPSARDVRPDRPHQHQVAPRRHAADHIAPVELRARAPSELAQRSRGVAPGQDHLSVRLRQAVGPHHASRHFAGAGRTGRGRLRATELRRARPGPLSRPRRRSAHSAHRRG